LYNHPFMKQYSEKSLNYILQNAIDSGFQLKDKYGRLGRLQAKKDLFAFTMDEHNTMQERFLQEETINAIQLPQYVPKQEEPEPEAEQPVPQEVDLGVHKAKLSTTITTNFSDEVVDWVIADTMLSKEEKRKYYVALDWTSLPINVRPLLIENKYLVVGKEEVYTKQNEKVDLIGKDKDLYVQWLNTRKQAFIAAYNNNILFASMKNQGLIFNYDDTQPDKLARSKTTKTIGGKQCTSFHIDSVKRLAQQLGVPFPTEIEKGTKPERCNYINYILRKACLESPDKIVWFTPEEFEIFNSSDVSKSIREKLT